MTKKNIFVENSEFQCVGCGRGLDITAMRAAERAEYKRTGYCPECLAREKEIKKALAAEKRAEREAAKAAAAEKRAKNPSAAARVRTLIENATFNDEQLEQLMDLGLTKTKTKIAYQLLKEIDDNADWETEVYFGGAPRYQKTPLNINGRRLYMTNNIYQKNIELVRKLLVEIGSLQDVAE